MIRTRAPHLLLTLAFFLGVAGTCAADQAQEASSLSLHEAIQLALAHDPDIELAALNLEAAQMEYDRQRSGDMIAGRTKSSETRTESDLKSARLAYVRDVDDAIMSIIDDAFALEIAVVRAGTRKDQLSSRQQALDLIVSREASGAAGKLDELSARTDLNTAQADLFAAQLSAQEAEQRLRQRLGFPEDKPVVIDDLPAFQTYSPPDDALARARNADPDLVQKQAAVSLAQIDLDTVRAAASAPLDVRKAANQLAVAKARLAKADGDLTLLFLNSMAAVQQTADDHRSATMSLQLARQRHDIILQQEATGQSTGLDVLDDTVALGESQASQLNTLKSYVKALMTLEVLIGTDLRPAHGEVPAE